MSISLRQIIMATALGAATQKLSDDEFESVYGVPKLDVAAKVDRLEVLLYNVDRGGPDTVTGKLQPFHEIEALYNELTVISERSGKLL